jgi:hypothetical protein
MAIHVLDKPRYRRAPVSPHFRLSHDRGGWTLSRPDGHARKFDTFEAGIDSARDAVPAPQTPIDIWQEGEYICCLSLDQWSHPARIAPTAPAKPLFPRTERVANRAARIVMAVAGPVFWLMLVVATLAASLGFKLALL